MPTKLSTALCFTGIGKLSRFEKSCVFRRASYDYSRVSVHVFDTEGDHVASTSLDHITVCPAVSLVASLSKIAD